MNPFRAAGSIAVVLAVMFGLLYLLQRRYGLGAVGFLFPPLVLAAGILISRYLVNGVPEAFRELKWWAWREADGRHYEYAHQPMRVIEMDGTLWLHERDVRTVLEIPDRTLIELDPEHNPLIDTDAEVYGAPFRSGDRCISLAGIRRIVEGRTERRAGGLLHWFERDVLGPWQRKRGIEPEFSTPMQVKPVKVEPPA
ncbi:hypothetical protein BH10PSE17_BH10PSE17_35960 [soil metagenome]